MDGLLRPDKPFQTEVTDMFTRIGDELTDRWLQKPIEAEQWRMASLAFLDTLYNSPARMES